MCEAAFAGLPLLVPLPTAAERAADVIRESIFEGRFRPGLPLPETSLATALQVSRNTVRDAFRTLVHERLLTYEVHRGVAVRRLSADDVRDIYGLRTLCELSALDLLRRGEARVTPEALGNLRACIEQAEAALAANEAACLAMGPADLCFHTRLTALHGSPRMDECFRRLMTELRLGFLAIVDPYPFHRRDLRTNREICDDLAAGRFDRARQALDRYLTEAQAEVMAAVSQSDGVR